MNKTINKQEALARLANLEKEAQALHEIIEQPEVGSILSNAYGAFGIFGYGGSFNAGNRGGVARGNNHFSSEKEAKDWAQAIDTLIALRRQPGSCKPVDGDKQYFILYCSEWNSCISLAFTDINKYCNISPCFISEECARQAIENIGKDKLLHMFKTLHGMN